MTKLATKVVGPSLPLSPALRGGVEEAARKLREDIAAVVEVARGEAPFWPNANSGSDFALVELRSIESMPKSPSRSTMKPSDARFTKEGLEQFTRALRKGIEKAKGAA